MVTGPEGLQTLVIFQTENSLATCKYDCKYIVRTLLPKVQFIALDFLQSVHDCVSVFGPFLVHFTFLQSVLGFMGLFGVQQKTSL